MSDFDDLGGEPVLRPLVERFVDRMFDDLMIGFFFRNSDRVRIKAMEYEHAAEHLGAAIRYSGRALRAAHTPHRIMGGQFTRRLTILREVLDDAGVPEAITQRWLQHSESLRPLITNASGGEFER